MKNTIARGLKKFSVKGQNVNAFVFFWNQTMTRAPCCDLLPLAYDLSCVGQLLVRAEAFVLQAPFVLGGDNLFLVASAFFSLLLYLILIVVLNPLPS